MDYVQGLSIWTHNDPEGLLRRFAGKGSAIRRTPENGYTENVDFGRVIGVWKNQEGTLELPTTKGTIHYEKEGINIVCLHPETHIDMK